MEKLHSFIVLYNGKFIRAYNQSEADEVIRRLKYKRCLAIAEICVSRYDGEDAKVNGHSATWDYISKEMKHWERWRQRWLELAKKFNPNNSTAQ